MSGFYVISDIHGHYNKLATLLHLKSFIDSNLNWVGGDATICFIGDFCNQGPDGIHCINLVMHLQQQAQYAGGRIYAQLGDHDLFLLAAYRFRKTLVSGTGLTFWECWKQSGGVNADIEHLTPVHIEWMSQLPVMLMLEGYLCVHSDTDRYSEFGDSIDKVNATIRAILQDDFTDLWINVIDVMSDRGAFLGHHVNGTETAYAFLKKFGGYQVVHGHTPIPYVTQNSDLYFTKPFTYAANYCINIDTGMQLKRPGLLWQLTPIQTATLLDPMTASQYSSPIVLDLARYDFSAA